MGLSFNPLRWWREQARIETAKDRYAFAETIAEKVEDTYKREVSDLSTKPDDVLLEHFPDATTMESARFGALIVDEIKSRPLDQPLEQTVVDLVERLSFDEVNTLPRSVRTDLLFMLDKDVVKNIDFDRSQKSGSELFVLDKQDRTQLSQEAYDAERTTDLRLKLLTGGDFKNASKAFGLPPEFVVYRAEREAQLNALRQERLETEPELKDIQHRWEKGPENVNNSEMRKMMSFWHETHAEVYAYKSAHLHFEFTDPHNAGSIIFGHDVSFGRDLSGTYIETMRSTADHESDHIKDYQDFVHLEKISPEDPRYNYMMMMAQEVNALMINEFKQANRMEEYPYRATEYNAFAFENDGFRYASLSRKGDPDPKHVLFERDEIITKGQTETRQIESLRAPPYSPGTAP